MFYLIFSSLSTGYHKELPSHWHVLPTNTIRCSPRTRIQTESRSRQTNPNSPSRWACKQFVVRGFSRSCELDKERKEIGYGTYIHMYARERDVSAGGKESRCSACDEEDDKVEWLRK